VNALIAPGARLPELRVDPVSPEAMKRMARVLHDPNRIHLDPEAVRAAGLGDRVINQGPSNCGYVMDMLALAFPGGELRSFQSRFLANVLGGDAVVAGGTVDAVDPVPYGLVLSCSVWLDVVGRGRALRGTARVHLPGRS
jgi:3-hydroxybutyryl-CoA dehydratase